MPVDASSALLSFHHHAPSLKHLMPPCRPPLLLKLVLYHSDIPFSPRVVTKPLTTRIDIAPPDGYDGSNPQGSEAGLRHRATEEDITNRARTNTIRRKVPGA